MKTKKTAHRELHDLYCSWSILRVGRLRRNAGWNMRHVWGKREAFRRPRLRCQDNIEMDLRERELNGVGRLHLAQGRDR